MLDNESMNGTYSIIQPDFLKSEICQGKGLQQLVKRSNSCPGVAYIYIYIYVCMNVCIYVYIYIYICIYVCIHIRVRCSAYTSHININSMYFYYIENMGRLHMGTIS